MPVADGQAVSAGITNPAFLDAQQDDTAFGRITLANAQPESGAVINNIQALANQLRIGTGATESTPGTDYSSETRITDGDTHETALGELDSAFHGVTGHTHDGSDGDGPNIPAVNIAGISLHLRYLKGFDHSGVSGASLDVSSDLALESASSGINEAGVPIFDPTNRSFINQVSGANDDGKFVDATGDIVYGRLTKVGLTWILSFYSNNGGTEGSYSFASPTNLTFWYPRLVNPIAGFPPYVPGEFVGVYGDYRDVSSLAVQSGTKRYGNIELVPGSGISILDLGNNQFQFNASGGGSSSGVDSISSDGGPGRTGNIDLISGTGVTITDNGDGSFTFDADSSASFADNDLYNGGLDLWQRYEGTNGPDITAADPQYVPDRFIAHAGWGTGEVLCTRASDPGDDTTYAADILVTDDPITPSNADLYMQQTLPNMNSLKYYGKNGSMAVDVKGNGVVNQVGVQFLYATTETRAVSGIGAEQLYSVNPSTYTEARIDGQAMGTAMTLAGVVGARVRVTGVVSGNFSDTGNGFRTRRWRMNLGNSAMPFKRMNHVPELERVACQAFFEKSYSDGVVPGSSDALGAAQNGLGASANDVIPQVTFKVRKHKSPTCLVYDNNGSNSGIIRNQTGGVQVSGVDSTDAQVAGFRVNKGGGIVAANFYSWHWTGEAEIY